MIGVITTPTNPPIALTTSTTPKNHAGWPAAFKRNASRNVRKPTPPRITAIAVPAKTMLGAASSERSSAVSTGATRPADGILSASTAAMRNTPLASISDTRASVIATIAAAGSPPATLATTAMSERREFASTSSRSSPTTAGTNAAFATA